MKRSDFRGFAAIHPPLNRVVGEAQSRGVGARKYKNSGSGGVHFPRCGTAHSTPRGGLRGPAPAIALK
jgi:hypothetical protein